MESSYIKGKVFSGKGEATRFTELPWAKKQIIAKLGFNPYPGTLNIKLTEDCFVLKNLLKMPKAIEIKSAAGFFPGRCFKAYLMDMKCAIVIPEVADYPQDVIEVIAPMNLKAKLQLKDGDTVKVKILLE